VAVNIHGEGDAGVPQPLADYLGIDPGDEQQGGVGVPQVMEADTGQPRFPKHPGESMVCRARVQGFVAAVAEDEVGFLQGTSR